MAYMHKGILGTALVAALAMPAVSAVHAVQYDSPSPVGMDLGKMLQGQLTGQAALSQLAIGNGLNIGNMTAADFGKALAMSALSSAMSGQFDIKAVLGQTAGMIAIGSMSNLGGISIGGGGGLGGGLGGLGGGGLGGISGGLGGGLGNFGGLEGFANAAMGQVVGKAVEMALSGGIQDGKKNNSSNIGNADYNYGGSVTHNSDATYDEDTGMYYDPDTGKYYQTKNAPITGEIKYGYNAIEAPILSQSGSVEPLGENYNAGAYDAIKDNGPDKRFKMSNGTYDKDYFCGYQKAAKVKAPECDDDPLTKVAAMVKEYTFY